MNDKLKVVFGPLGAQRDARNHSWRPTVALCSSPDKLRVDRLELLFQEEHALLAQYVKEDIAAVSPTTKVNLHLWPARDAWDFQDVYSRLHAFTREYDFRQDKEEYLIHMTTGTYVMQICLFLLAARRDMPAQLVNTIPPEMQKGPIKVVNIDRLYEQTIEGPRREWQKQAQVLAGYVDWGSKFKALLNDIEDVSLKSRAPMLLTGPTGSGKSFVARRIYELKKEHGRVTGRFVEVNCATLRGERAASDLFGHEKGAYTGAHKERSGLIADAHKGILFLDEISELEWANQGTLLTVLDTRRIRSIGSSQEREINFELIAATNRDLRQAVENGDFREDLYFRISDQRFALPGLDRRRDDIEPFVNCALDDLSGEFYDRTRILMESDARTAFLDFAVDTEWPGNLRQLKQAVRRMACWAKAGHITLGEVDRVVAELSAEKKEFQGDADDALLRSLVPADKLGALDHIERVQLSHVLRVCRCSDSIAAAGRILWDKSRRAKASSNDSDRLSKYLKRHGLDWRQVKSELRSGEA